MIVLSILIVLLIAAVVFAYYKNRQHLEKTRNEILAELEGNNPYGTPLEEDEEYWQLFRHDTAAEVLKTYFASGDSGLPNEEELANTVLRYVDTLITKLRQQP